MTEMVELGRKERLSFIQRFASRFKFPQLFLLLVVLFLADVFIPDPIPFIDEVILGLLAVLIGMWREERDEKSPDIETMKNVTPPKEP